MLLVAVISLGQRGITGRFLLLDFERKKESESLAQSCVNVGIIYVVNDPTYTTSNASIPVGSHTCTIVSIVSPSPFTQSTIQTRGEVSVNNATTTTNYEAKVRTSDGSLTSWKECKDLIGGTCH